MIALQVAVPEPESLRRWNARTQASLRNVTCIETGKARSGARAIEYDRAGKRTHIDNPSEGMWAYAGCAEDMPAREANPASLTGR